MLDTLREIGGTLGRSKLRTALTGLSVSVGIFLLIVLLGAGNGIIHAFELTANRLPMNIVNMYPGWTSKPFQGMKEGRRIKFDQRDLDLIGRQFSDRVSEKTPRLYVQSGAVLDRKGRQASSDLIGVYPADLEMDGRHIVEGRFVNALDLEQHRKVIAISEKQRDVLFRKGEHVIGEYIRAGKVSYRIVGVFSNDPMSQNKESYLPFTTAKVVYNRGTDVGYLRFRADGVYTQTERDRLKTDIRQAESRLHRFAPDDERGLWIYNSADGAEETSQAMGILRTGLWMLGLLTLLSGVVGVSNIMLITVKERTHEFGIRKALGARPWSILRSVMLESVIITPFFGYVGLVAGIAATEYLNFRAGQEVFEIHGMEFPVFLNPTVDMGVAIDALLVLILAGVLAGFIPARRAVSVKPIEALRSE